MPDCLQGEQLEWQRKGQNRYLGGKAKEGDQRKDSQKTEEPGRNGELETKGSCGGITGKVKCSSKMKRQSGLGVEDREPLQTSVRAGSLGRWTQMTDGSVLRREREVTRGGAKSLWEGAGERISCGRGGRIKGILFLEWDRKIFKCW